MSLLRSLRTTLPPLRALKAPRVAAARRMFSLPGADGLSDDPIMYREEPEPDYETELELDLPPRGTAYDAPSPPAPNPLRMEPSTAATRAVPMYMLYVRSNSNNNIGARGVGDQS